ncbi:MAG TPA: hypothetical protein DDY82_04945 [Clostridiales bacterium]|nr:hypothetical protein [Clostridiales bacterium]HBJ98390.1 hypothetical protein [Clostridiales bacterium]
MNKIEEILNQNGSFICQTKGVSMEPLFKEGRDRVVIAPIKKRLKKYDVALYKRGEEYVLHRVVKVKKSGYKFVGDNTLKSDFVLDKDVVGKAIGYFREEKYKKSLKNIFYVYRIRIRYYLLTLKRIICKKKTKK